MSQSLRFIFLLIALAMFLIAGCGIESIGIGSVKFKPGWFGLLFLALTFWA